MPPTEFPDPDAKGCAVRGKIALFRGKGIIGRLIRWQTRSPYSHAAILLPDGETVLESREFAGVQLRTLTAEDWDIIDLFEVEGMNDEAWAFLWELGAHHIGEPYDYLAVLKFVSRRPARENGRWFCSEFVCSLVARTFRKLLNKSCHESHPGDLAESILLLPCSPSNPSPPPPSRP